MFNFRTKRSDFIYEKASRSSSDDGSASEEAQAFLTQDRWGLAPSDFRKFKLLAIVSLVCSGLLNVSLLGLIAHQYAHRGPSSPLFPELVYCKPPKICHLSYQDIMLTRSHSSRPRRHPLRSQGLQQRLRRPENKIYGRQLRGRRRVDEAVPENRGADPEIASRPARQ